MPGSALFPSVCRSAGVILIERKSIEEASFEKHTSVGAAAYRAYYFRLRAAENDLFREGFQWESNS
jgi:hypothetical protein